MDKDLGQYFTENNNLRNFITRHVQNTNGSVLEPSFGLGHLIMDSLRGNPWRRHVGIELDSRLKSKSLVDDKCPPHKFMWGVDFLEHNFDEKFSTIIGNPPYIKVGGYIKFVEKCYDLLEDGGEMLMIVPSDFLHLTSAADILQRMVPTGAFTHIWYPEDESLFKGASIDVMVFRYVKSETMNYPYITQVTRKKTISPVCFAIENGRLIRATENSHPIWKDFHVMVGMVSGKDEVFKVPFGNASILTAKDKVEKFIFVDKFPTKIDEINSHLLKNKDLLMTRKIVKQTEENWFKWGAPRNISMVQQNLGKKCIYVKTLTRDEEVAFMGEVKYFGSNLLCLIPNFHSKINLKHVTDYLNSEEGRKEYTFAGRYKMGPSLLQNIKYPLEQIPVEN